MHVIKNNVQKTMFLNILFSTYMEIKILCIVIFVPSKEYLSKFVNILEKRDTAKSE